MLEVDERPVDRVRCAEVGDREENLANAIACYERSLTVLTEKDFPAYWATTQNNLSEAERLLAEHRRSN
ncbi:hypothetical protein [Pseudobythopirellula maris]|uniref:hypothetical protein n=1 Tax=Pseudobythopirellula maris TaxID=2527991 RepID=UPI0011B4FC88|nr:hypothetical protein [Pseudobythopirellula maris]